MAEYWERVYAKFFYVICFVVIGLAGLFLFRSDPKLVMKLSLFLGAWLVLVRLIPTQWKFAVRQWACKSRSNIYLFWLAFGVIFGTTHLLVQRTESLDILLFFVLIFPLLAVMFYRKRISAGNGGADSQRQS